MECERCRAPMVYESFDDVKMDAWPAELHGWRCPVCGNVLDPVILANRANVHGAGVSGARKRHNAQAL